MLGPMRPIPPPRSTIIWRRLVRRAPSIGVDYDDSGDKAVELWFHGGGSAVFAGGDPVADYARASECARRISSNPVMMQSSVDHFVHDVPGFAFDANGNLVRVG